MSIDAMKQALAALEIGDPWHPTTIAAIKALNNAIEQAQDPVAWVGPSWLHPETRTWVSESFAPEPIDGWIPLYTAPQTEQQCAHGINQKKCGWCCPAPKQEPVCDKDPQGCWNVRCQLGKVCKHTPGQWQGLTEAERERATGWSVEHIEAKLREKNA